MPDTTLLRAITVAANSLRFNPELDPMEAQVYEQHLWALRDRLSQEAPHKHGPITKAAVRHKEVITQAAHHHECFQMMPCDRDKELDEQGFMTADGVFVDRKLAYEIALAYDQVKPNTPSAHFKELFSEDVEVPHA